MKEITSLQNPLVKQIIELKTKSAKRKEMSRCVVEGAKEIEIAISSGLVIEKLLVEKDMKYPNWIEAKDIDLYHCSRQIMDKIAMRRSSNSLVAMAQTKSISFDHVQLSENPFILILENIEKPGNLGSLFRTSDAANVDLILCTEMRTDLYNPNVIRNSLGCVFSKQIIHCTNQEALDFCKRNKILTYATFLHTDTYYYSTNFQKPSTIIFGTESIGISEFWQQHADSLIKIPMLGKIDSMNVSNSASILLYEVVRQRFNS